ncbi:hypothetical protein L4D09_19655 [Photobacterium makurazakiensis]|uniref:hypothetical protein n=1 Tax=Photobacterium makurazakiensis TaxID=2910234 RepID=UPI003D12385A
MADVMPVRTSTNKVEGINRCECGNVRTIHRARGKRSKYLYSICDDCGTNQQTGQFWQSRFKVNFATLEELHQSEQPAVEQALEPEMLPESDTEVEPQQTEIITEQVEPQSEPETQTNSEQTEPVAEKKPSAWRAVIAGLVLGGLTGGLITRF